jgi:hypothetical protein
MNLNKIGWYGAKWIQIPQGMDLLASSCELGNENSDFIKRDEFLESLNDYYLLKMHSAPYGELVTRFILFQ